MMNRFRQMLFLGGLSLAVIQGCDSSTTQPTPAPVDLTVQTYTSDLNGFAIANHLIMGKTDAILVDGNYFRADVDKLVAMIKGSGKTLRAIWLTHAHQDHYLGLDIIATAFPGVPIQTTPEVLADYQATSNLRFSQTKAQFGTGIADKLATVTAVTTDKLTLEGEELRIVKLPDGESSVASALYAPRQRLLFSGDAGGGDSHFFTAECRIDKMVTVLGILKAVGPIDKVYPGHGTSGGPATNFDHDAKYLGDAKNILSSSLLPAEAASQLKSLYPNFSASGIADFSSGLFFSWCRPPAQISGFKQPESAYFDPTTKYWYVSNINGTGGMKDGNGSLTRVSADLKTVEHNWVTGLNDPTGIRAIGNNLYVADVDAIVRIDMTTKASTRYPIAIGIGGFLNDIATDGSRYVFASETFANKIWRLDTAAAPPISTMIVQNVAFKNPNGLLVDGSKLYMVATGSFSDPNDKANMWSMNLDGTGAAVFGTITGKFDGLEKVGTNWWLSGFTKTVQSLDAQATMSTVIHDFAPDKLSSAADFGYDSGSKTLAVPDVVGTNVAFYVVQ